VFHFAPNNEETPLYEEPELGFYLADGDFDHQFQRLDLITTDISIAPGESDYTVTVRSPFTQDALIWDFHIHMHNRGKSAHVNLYYPDGRLEQVFRMPKFSFDWQRHYYLQEPVFAPKGTIAEFIAVWDNSANNSANPDPTKRVEYGSLTGDEMGNANLTYTPARAHPLPLRFRRGARIGAADTPEAEHALALNAVIQAKSREELAEFLEEQPPDNRRLVISIWEAKHGPYDPSSSEQDSAIDAAIQAMSREELKTVLELQTPENRPKVIDIWEAKNGPYNRQDE
jgi:hypothetical protein